MAPNQSGGTAEAPADPILLYSRDALRVEREARAVEREARMLEEEVLRNEPRLVPNLADLLAATDAAITLCQELLDAHPDDWDERGLVESVQSQLEDVAGEIRAGVEASVPPGQSGAAETSQKASSTKK